MLGTRFSLAEIRDRTYTVCRRSDLRLVVGILVGANVQTIIKSISLASVASIHG